MTRPSSALYHINHSSLEKSLVSAINKGCEQASEKSSAFFRADDIGIPSRGFLQLIGCFQKHRLPLCLATVPTWLTEQRLQNLYQLTGKKNSQWCWHQHGRLHRNFETSGKKQEFGPSRNKDEIVLSLNKGRKRLEQLLGTDFHPVFTPPWNRCSADTLQSLIHLGFKAVSRSRGAEPKSPPSLPDYQVNIDLHTRKELDPHQSLKNLLLELEQGLASGRCGIMIHHQRMNRAAFEFLDILLGLIATKRDILPVHFGHLLP